jgi:hypothetical protein
MRETVAPLSVHMKTRLGVKKLRHRVMEVLAVILCGMTIGAGMGFLQGLVVYLGPLSVRTGLWDCGDAVQTTGSLGGFLAALLVPVLYYAYLRKRLTTELAAVIVMVSLAVGLVSALVIPPLSVYATPAMAFWASRSLAREGLGLDVRKWVRKFGGAGRFAERANRTLKAIDLRYRGIGVLGAVLICGSFPKSVISLRRAAGGVRSSDRWLP